MENVIVFNNFENFKNTSYKDFFKIYIKVYEEQYFISTQQFQDYKMGEKNSKIEENELVKIYVLNIKNFDIWV